MVGVAAFSIKIAYFLTLDICKMIDCGFALNGKPMSTFKCGAMTYSAFSGLGPHANRREFSCYEGVGPIPPGTYYIFDRQSGGLMGSLRDMLNGHGEWFALYAVDGRIDDETFCNQVKRGRFRLHPKGTSGISQGCITLENKSEYQKLRAFFLSFPPVAVPGVALKAYGRVIVK